MLGSEDVGKLLKVYSAIGFTKRGVENSEVSSKSKGDHFRFLQKDKWWIIPQGLVGSIPGY